MRYPQRKVNARMIPKSVCYVQHLQYLYVQEVLGVPQAFYVQEG